MNSFICKQCGGTLVQQEGSTWCCEYCGHIAIIEAKDEYLESLKLRAQEYFVQSDFKAAAEFCSSAIAHKQTDSESYWLRLLSRQGIQYVHEITPEGEDRYVPTCYLMAVSPFLENEDYNNAVLYAENDSLEEYYRREGKRIDEIQTRILSVARSLPPYDVFICFKATNEEKRRTREYAVAQELYHLLKDEGYRVFFSEETLSDVAAGNEYEAHIFSAINTAKIMFVISNSRAYFESEWVKNEWHRYLSRVRQDEKLSLIPYFNTMLMAEDDLPPILKPYVRFRAPEDDLNKLVSFVKEKLPSAKTSASAAIAGTLKRIELLLEDGNWEEAERKCDGILNTDPRLGEAHLLMLMAKLHISKRIKLADAHCDLAENPHYQQALSYCGEEIRNDLLRYRTQSIYRLAESAIKTLPKCTFEIFSEKEALISDWISRIDTYRNTPILRDSLREIVGSRYYSEGLKEQSAIKSCLYDKVPSVAEHAASLFRHISGYKDADIQAEKCLYMHKDRVYDHALEIMDTLRSCSMADLPYLCKTTHKLFLSLDNHRDSAKQAENCLLEKEKRYYSEGIRLKKIAKENNHYESAVSAKEMFVGAGTYNNAPQQAEYCICLMEAIQKITERAKQTAVLEKTTKEKEWLDETYKEYSRIKKFPLIAFVTSLLQTAALIVLAFSAGNVPFETIRTIAWVYFALIGLNILTAEILYHKAEAAAGLWAFILSVLFAAMHVAGTLLFWIVISIALRKTRSHISVKKGMTFPVLKETIQKAEDAINLLTPQIDTLLADEPEGETEI